MTDNSNRYGSEPLGKSVEEIESESGNLVNSPVEGEQRREESLGAGLPPVIATNANTTVMGGIVNPASLTDDLGSGADDGRARPADGEGEV